MNKIFTLFFLLFLVFANFLYGQDFLRILTYNIQGQRPGSNPETRLFHIIQKLKMIDPDIIGLQEINEDVNGTGQDNQGQRIADSLSAFFGTTYFFYQGFTHLSWNNQFREYIGIITKYPVEQDGFHNLPPGVFPRKVVWNYINTPLGRINFFNTHLSFNSNTVRISQVQTLIPYIRQQETIFPGIASILTGDFNSIPDSEPISLLTHSGTDTFYFDTFREINPTSPGFTVPAQSPDARIDFVFEKNNGNIEIDTSKVVMDQPYSGSNYCSDHYAVLTVFIEDTSASGLSVRPFLDFGDVLVNFPSDTLIRIFNPGAGVLHVTNISSSDPAFTFAPTAFTVQPGDSQFITGTFTPAISGNFTGIMRIENNAGRDRYVFLSGNGITFTTINFLDFGYVLENSSKDSVISVSNVTPFDITITDITSNNPVFSATPTSFILPAGSSENITTTFSPDSVGLMTGTLTFESTAGNPTIAISGTGVEASSWTIQTSGTTNNLLAVYATDSSRCWAVGDNGTILKTSDGGTTWMSQISGTQNLLRSLYFVNENSGWAVGNGGTILHTIDGGITWLPQASGTSAILVSVYFISEYTGWVVGSGGAIRKTIDGGVNWFSQSSGTISFLSSLHFSSADTGWAVGENGTILKTIDGGVNWLFQTSGTSNILWSVHFTGMSNGWIVGENGTILRTINGGENWLPQSINTDLDLFSVYFTSSNNGWMVGEDGIILKTKNGGDMWIPQFSGVSHKLKSVFFADNHIGYIVGDGGIILNTRNGGIASGLRNGHFNTVTPLDFKLFQNYPNPFNPTTTIEFALPHSGFVTLKIYNILGEEVTTLIAERLMTGTYHYGWDASELSSGLYIYHIVAGNFSETKKMLLLK